MSEGLFDPKNKAALDIAANLLRYPFEYCSREVNRSRHLLPYVKQYPALGVAISNLDALQSTLCRMVEAPDLEVIWASFLTHADFNHISTSPINQAPRALAKLHERAHIQLNVHILECALDAVKQLPIAQYSTAGLGYLLRDMASCIWLSNHVALVVLGIAKAESDSKGVLHFSSTSQQKARSLQHAWFGGAFDDLSLRADSAAIEAFARAIVGGELAQIEELRVSASTIFAKQWRLPVQEGPVRAMFAGTLLPLIDLTAYAMAQYLSCHKFGVQAPLTREFAAKINAESVFERVLAIQSTWKPSDKLFKLQGNGLVLGSRKPATALLALAEELAKEELGKEWHDSISDVQKRYLLSRLDGAQHLDILPGELRQSDTTGNIAIDVDLFVRDRAAGKLYAIQLKHLENADQSSFLDWISRFRNPEAGLGKAAKQLRNLRKLVKSDVKVQARLRDVGVKDEEHAGMVPIVVHNIGSIDFWTMDGGVQFYDLPTFCNVLKGQEHNYAIMSLDKGTKRGSGTRGTIGLALDDPGSVIRAYLEDPTDKWKDLRAFDYSVNLLRELRTDEAVFRAIGLGI